MAEKTLGQISEKMRDIDFAVLSPGPRAARSPAGR